MTRKHVSLLAGTVLSGALLLGTAGLALAQDPTATPTSSPTPGLSGGMMGRQGMMGGQMHADEMAAMNSAMGASGQCDSTTMQSLHQQSHPSR
jgi:hypothetical protein